MIATPVSSLPEIAPIAPRLSGLKERVRSAAGYAMLGYVLAQGLRFASNLITTRLLVPEMFGVMAIAQAVMVGLSFFSDVGLASNIIHSRRGTDPRYLNTAWAVQILRGSLVMLLVLLSSGLLYGAHAADLIPAGTVYASPLLPAVMAALSVSAFISGCESTRMPLAIRGLGLAPVMKIELCSQIAATVVTVAWAWHDHSVWGLVAGWTVGASVRSLLTHMVLPGAANRWEWDPSAVHEILHFGKWVFCSSILTFLVANGDRLLLGGLVTPQSLGLYSIAFLIVSAVQLALSRLVGYVAFPAFSEVVREHPEHLKRAYYKVRLPIDIVALCWAGIFFAFGPLIIRTLYDARYAGAGEMLQVLGLMLVAGRYEVLEQCLLAMGKPRLLTLMNLCRLSALYLAVPLGFHFFGVKGAIWAIVGASFAGLPFGLYLKLKHGLLDPTREIGVIGAFAVLAAVCAALGA